ncbi:GerAB/ArcD/ProY family transporter [Tumebacillus permanentifrigoris]|uniref:Spore germination protein (Amino acid permease) n=1 Tax=Tumebacillus permanentifrigoris TaxID=378543 RepID=A0A316D6M6_9BACL|nr:GerAB/ArcD/ProY family transporter [Tumebacillus permanentifrigoris]PWK10244.1 spore germination protein (amino acid permease) [Tumebacillus permanentifrigoris]
MSHNQISPGGFTAILSLTLESTTISIGISPLFQQAHEDAWMVPPLAMVAALLVLFPLYRLFARLGTALFNHERTLSIWESLLLVPLCLVLLYWMVFNTRVFSDVILMSFLPGTPNWVVYGGFLAVCAFASFHGIEVLARVALLVVFIKSILVGVTPVFVLEEVDVNNFLPLLARGPSPVLWGVLESFSWFAEGAMLAFLFPLVQKGRFRHVIYGYLLSMETYYVYFISSVLIFTAPLVSRMVYPALLLVQMMAVGDFFDRIDPILVSVWAFAMFVKVGVYLLILSALLSRLLRVKIRTRLSWLLALLGVFLTDSIVHNVGHEIQVYREYWPWVSVVVLVDLYLLGWALHRRSGTLPLHAPPVPGEDKNESWNVIEGRVTDGST